MAEPKRRWEDPSIVLPILLLVGAVLRLFRLGHLPNGLFCDEAANGLDAWSLLKTGRSLHGDVWPLFLNHHGTDWVEPLYTWAAVPSVALFGRTAFAIRLPAAVAGTLGILVVWLAVRRMAGPRAAILAAAFTALSPWHLVFSRVGFRAILLPLAIGVAVWQFVGGLQAPRRHWPLAGLALGIGLWTYSVARAYVPLAVVAMLLAYARPVRKVLRHEEGRRAALVAALILAALALPIYGASFWGSANARFGEISIFAHPRPVARFVMNLLLQLDPLFLFLDGDANPRAGVGGLGPALLLLAPFAVTGAFCALRDRAARLALLLFLAGAVPAALTATGIPHSLRAIGSVPWLEVLAAIGVVELNRTLRRGPPWTDRANAAARAIVAITLAANAALFLWVYFDRYPEISARGFQYGWEEAIAAAEEKRGEWDLALLSPRENQPYVFPLFYGSSSIEGFQRDGGLLPYEALDPQRAGRSMPPGRYGYIARPCEVVKGAPARLVKTVTDLREEPVLELWEVELSEPTWVGLAKRGPCGRPVETGGRRLSRWLRSGLHRAFGLEAVGEG